MAVVEAGTLLPLAPFPTLCHVLTRIRYKDGTIDGSVIGPWVGSTWHFNEALARPRLEDYKIRYCSKNRFAYLGHGRTAKELNGADLASHLREPGA